MHGWCDEELQGSWWNRRGMSNGRAVDMRPEGWVGPDNVWPQRTWLIALFFFFLNMVGSHWIWTFEQESDITTFYILPFARITESLLNEDWELGIWQGCSSLVTLTVCQWSGGDKGLTEVSSPSDGRWGREDWKSGQLFGITLQERIVVEKWIDSWRDF